MIAEIISSQNIVNLHNEKDQLSIDVTKTIMGFLLFIIIFVVIIPLILFKNNMFIVLEAYMPNLDIIASILTWHGGPASIWTNLYTPSPLNLYGFSSQVAINYIALLGLTYIIARETKRTNSLIKGWSIAFVMIFMTYLLPVQIISWLMDSTYNNLSQYNISNDYTLVVFIGFAVAAGIIASEAYIINVYRKYIETVATNIMNIPKLL